MKGTCTRLEMSLDRALLWLACRHHILELLAKAVWDTVFPGKSQCPGELLIKQFSDWWAKAESVPRQFEAKDRPILLGGNHHLEECIQELKELSTSARANGKSSFQRGDYEELLELLEVNRNYHYFISCHLQLLQQMPSFNLFFLLRLSNLRISNIFLTLSLAANIFCMPV